MVYKMKEDIEEEIKIGEYVRTIDGKIAIFDRYSSREEKSLYKSPFNCFIKLQGRKTPLQCDNGYIVKHSPNLTDLIEEGDYVNGKKVVELDFEDETILVLPIYTSDELFNAIEHYVHLEHFKIKTIVTHEQFESASYEVE